MRSLRSRLILGFALVALVPLAITIVLLTDRMERMVRDQAADRVTAGLGAVTAQLAEDQRSLITKTRILARDAELRRLYLIGSSGARDLDDLLEERRFLLGLDFLRITDAAGQVRADAARAVASAGGSRSAARPALASAPSRFGVSLRTLEGDSGLALVSRTAIEYQGATVGEVEGGLALDASYLEAWLTRTGVHFALRDAQGRSVAGDAGMLLPGSTAPGRRRWVGTTGADLGETVPLAIGEPPYPLLVGGMSTADAEHSIAVLQWASGVLGLAALAIGILLGVAWSRQVSRPVERLASYSEKLARGEWDEPIRIASIRELETLVDALERMRRDLSSYRDRLVVSERQAAWSLMARKVAHEVKNPLTPIAISIADLKRSYEANRPDFPSILDQAVRTVSEEVEALKRMLHEFSEFGRFPAPRIQPCRWSDLASDVETLYRAEVAAGRLAVSDEGRAIVFPADAGQIRQALVNLIRNGLDATAAGGRVTVGAAVEDGTVTVTVADTGPGLTPEDRARLFTPGFTTKSDGSGLGLTIVERIVSDHGGRIEVRTAPGQGTAFALRLPLERKA